MKRLIEAKEKGLKVGIIRPITLWPFPYEAFEKALNRKKDFLVVEMSTGQMIDDVKIAVNGRADVHFYGRTGGVVPTPNEILANDGRSKFKSFSFLLFTHLLTTNQHVHNNYHQTR